MPKNKSQNSRAKRGHRQRHLSVRSELLREPDVNKIARAVVALALAQAEKDAAEQAEKARQSDD